MKNMKFHLIAILSICVIIFGVYTFMTPPQQAATPATGAGANNGRSIKIYSATWGENCNPYIEQALVERRSHPIKRDDKGNPVELPKLVKAEPNNVLELVAGSCNGQQSCGITPTSEKLKFEPMEACSKQLVIGYRCYQFDRMSNLTIEQNITSTIECKQDAPAAAASH